MLITAGPHTCTRNILIVLLKYFYINTSTFFSFQKDSRHGRPHIPKRAYYMYIHDICTNIAEFGVTAYIWGSVRARECRMWH